MKAKHFLLAGAIVTAIAATGCASDSAANNAAKLNNQVNRTISNARHSVEESPITPIRAKNTTPGNDTIYGETLRNDAALYNGVNNAERFGNSNGTYALNRGYGMQNAMPNSEYSVRNGIITNRAYNAQGNPAGNRFNEPTALYDARFNSNMTPNASLYIDGMDNPSAQRNVAASPSATPSASPRPTAAPAR